MNITPVKMVMIGLTTESDVLLDAGEAPAIVRVKDLQVVVRGPTDAWGRMGRTQLALLSVEAWLREPFKESSSTDAVADDTVHYGRLSSSILTSMERLMEDVERENGPAPMLDDWVGAVWMDILEKDNGILGKAPLRYLRLEIRLPKALLIGNGATLAYFTSFDEHGYRRRESQSMTLHQLRMPVIIGVNANERAAKQTVIVNLKVDGCDVSRDMYNDFETIVTKVRILIPKEASYP